MDIRSLCGRPGVRLDGGMPMQPATSRRVQPMHRERPASLMQMNDLDQQHRMAETVMIERAGRAAGAEG
jgi:hypothetical protein